MQKNRGIKFFFELLLLQLSSGQPTVSPEQAKQFALRWLDQYQPGSSTEAADAFYGYYTLHTTKDGKVTGMLSVNG